MMRFLGIELFERELISSPQGEPYISRLKLLRTPWGGVMLHHIYRSDWDRAPHDHPWGFVSILLKGSYREVFRKQRRGGNFMTYDVERMVVRRAPGIYYRPAVDLHRLELYKNPDGSEKSVWTLVLCGPRRRKWGFLTETGWVHHQDYIELGQSTRGEDDE